MFNKSLSVERGLALFFQSSCLSYTDEFKKKCAKQNTHTPFQNKIITIKYNNSYLKLQFIY